MVPDYLDVFPGWGGMGGTVDRGGIGGSGGRGGRVGRGGRNRTGGLGLRFANGLPILMIHLMKQTKT